MVNQCWTVLDTKTGQIWRWRSIDGGVPRIFGTREDARLFCRHWNAGRRGRYATVKIDIVVISSPRSAKTTKRKAARRG